MELYSFFRSSAAYRVRIALGLKGLDHHLVPVNLMNGQQRQQTYLKENPQGLVPALKLDSGDVLSQSSAILEWLEETYPYPALYPSDPIAKTHVRALCQHVACDIHPLNNLRVLNYLEETLQLSKEQVADWYAHWLHRGFSAIETAVDEFESAFSLGEHPGMFEVFLIPQVFNAYRFNVNLNPFPKIVALDKRCQALGVFALAHPSRQPDTPQEERL